MFYIVSDIDGTVRRKCSRHIRRILKSSQKIHREFHLVTHGSRQALNGFVFECRKTLTKKEEQLEHQYQELFEQKAMAEERLKYFRRVKDRVDGLLGAVSGLEDHEAKGVVGKPKARIVERPRSMIPPSE